MKITLTESKLRKIVSETIVKTLNELSTEKYADAANKSYYRGQADRGYNFEMQLQKIIANKLAEIGCTTKDISFGRGFLQVSCCSNDGTDISFTYVKREPKICVDNPIEFANYMTNHKECARTFASIVEEFDSNSKFDDFHFWMDRRNLRPLGKIHESKALNELR